MKEQITIDDFAKLDLRVGHIEGAALIDGADRLVKLQVNVGDPQSRTIVAGIRPHYTVEDLVGQQIIVLCNLPPRVMKGVESHGMLLAAKCDDLLGLLTPNRLLPPGSIVG